MNSLLLSSKLVSDGVTNIVKSVPLPILMRSSTCGIEKSGVVLNKEYQLGLNRFFEATMAERLRIA